MNWKIERDPIYKRLAETFGEDFIHDAGFIEDKSPVHQPITTDLRCTPIGFLLERLHHSINPAIILMTGSFCPFHDGHLEMAEKAAEAVKKAGYEVIGGYIAPDNDEYVMTKSNMLNIHERIAIIEKQISHMPWLAIDPWSGVFRKYAENFTDIYLHLQAYIKKYLYMDIPIFYVCGGDNARFCQTFALEGNCVVVSRPGYDMSKYEKYFDGKRILHVENDNRNSSTEVRKRFWHDGHEKDKLIVRVTDNDERGEKILELLKERFEVVEVQTAESQKHIFDKINFPLISLDSIFGENKLELSRCYDYYGSKFLHFTNRPGTPSFEEQIAKFAPGEYILFDDDIHSGGTISFAKSLIEQTRKDIKIVGNFSFHKSTKKEEILDLRDFYVDTDNSGLVIKGFQEIENRYPYIYPFVCPYQRASIKDPMEFSIKVWEINRDYFKKKFYLHPKEFCEYMINNLRK